MISISIVFLFLLSASLPVINSQKTNPEDELNLEEEELYDLLIISPSKFKRILNKLVDHKNSYGVKTNLVTLDYVYDCISFGNDDAEKIKLFIKNELEEHQIKYVLLVGGRVGQLKRWYVPVRYVHTGNDYELEFLSDYYFADIYDSEGNFSSWDSDGDGKYSEWVYGQQPEDTDLDLTPDVAVGRLPVRNKLELRVIVNKIIKYEKTSYGKAWYNELLAIAGDTYPEYKNPLWVGYEGEEFADMIIENMTDFNATRLYTSDGTLTHWKDIVREYKKGWGFVYFAGHGSAMVWQTHFPNDKNRTKSFSTLHMPLLNNKDELPVCVVGGCHNCQFDVTLLNLFDSKKLSHGEAIPECWGWTLTKKFRGGSIATIGCTALGHTKEDKDSFEGGVDICEVEFFKEYAQNDVDIIGDAWLKALDFYAKSYPVPWEDEELTNDSWVDMQIVQSWALLGDPSLKMGGYP